MGGRASAGGARLGVGEIRKVIVYVVMGNGYPEAVFSVYDEARKFCEEKSKTQGTRIFWRSYSFTIDEHVR